jgi:CHAT domain-containing protein
LLSWRTLKRPSGHHPSEEGIFHHPFDFLDFLNEEAASSPVALTLNRFGQQKTVRFYSAAQSLSLRPNFQEEELKLYLAATGAIDAGRFSEGFSLWWDLADKTSRFHRSTLAAWHFSRLAMRSANLGKIEEAKLAADRATIEAESSTSPRFQSRVWTIIGQTLHQANDYSQAEAYFRRALAVHQFIPDKSLLKEVVFYELSVLALEKGDLETAYSFYQAALQLVTELAPKSLEHANLLDSLGGNIAYHRGDIKEANRLRQKALAIRRQLAPGSLTLTVSLINLGANYFNAGNLARAERLFQEALAIAQQLAPRGKQTDSCLNNLGNINVRRGEFAEAEKFYLKSLEITEETSPGSLSESETLDNLGQVAYYHDDLDGAEFYFQKALAIQQAVGATPLILSNSLSNIANIYFRRGRLLDAERLYRKSLSALETAAPRSLDYTYALESLGLVAYRRGDILVANDFFLKSLEIRSSQFPENAEIAGTLNGLGIFSTLLGDLSAAERYHRKALKIRKRSAPGSIALADTLLNLGSLAKERGRYAEAKTLFREALVINQAQSSPLSVAICLESIGNVEQALRHNAAAADFFQRALSIYQRITPDTVDEVSALSKLSAVEKALGHNQTSRQLLKRATYILESQLEKLGGAQELQANFMSSYGSVYKEYISLLAQDGDLPSAFKLTESYRGVVLLRMLAEREPALDGRLSPDLALRQHQLDEEQDRIFTLLSENKGDRRKALDALEIGLRELRDRKAALRDEIQRNITRSADFRHPQPLDASSIQTLMDPGLTILSYSVGSNATQLFILAADRPLQLHTIPLGEAAIREKIELFRNLLSGPGRIPITGQGDVSPLQTTARSLYKELLQPASASLERSDRILIVPDGPLHLLPWGAIIRETDPSPENQGRNWQYLAEWKPISTVLSATLFTELKKSRHQAPQKSVLPTIAAFGDPWIPRTLTVSKTEAIEDIRIRSAADRGFRFEPLPASRVEVNQIASLFPQATTYLGPEATEENAKALPRNTRIVHFATHATLDERFPLNSAVVLSIPEKFEEGKGNGLLQAWEIFEQVRLDADLVVLSACESGLGKEMGGEGLIGLTRAFQYAGARSVMASLWKISDRTTAELMVRFYKHLKDGLPKDEALRAAQMELIRGPIQVKNEKGEVEEIDASAPYYWAAFQIYGDWQ